MANQHLTYGGGRVDIGPDSMRLMKTIHDEFIDAVLFDSLDVLLKADKASLAHLLRAEESKVHINRTTGKVTRMLKERTSIQVQ